MCNSIAVVVIQHVEMTEETIQTRHGRAPPSILELDYEYSTEASSDPGTTSAKACVTVCNSNVKKQNDAKKHVSLSYRLLLSQLGDGGLYYILNP